MAVASGPPVQAKCACRASSAALTSLSLPPSIEERARLRRFPSGARSQRTLKGSPIRAIMGIHAHGTARGARRKAAAHPVMLMSRDQAARRIGNGGVYTAIQLPVGRDHYRPTHGAAAPTSTRTTRPSLRRP